MQILRHLLNSAVVALDKAQTAAGHFKELPEALDTLSKCVHSFRRSFDPGCPALPSPATEVYVNDYVEKAKRQLSNYALDNHRDQKELAKIESALEAFMRELDDLYEKYRGALSPGAFFRSPDQFP